MKGNVRTTPERSRLMASVRQSQTELEGSIARIIGGIGVDYEMSARGLPGKPDFANRDQKWAMFANGCFWHNHEGCKRASVPRTNSLFWEEKFEKNRERDRRMSEALIEQGYSVLTVWQCELEKKARVERRLASFLSDHIAPRECYRFLKSDAVVERSLNLGTTERRTILKNDALSIKPPYSARDSFDYSYLRLKRRLPWNTADTAPVRIVDLFCGCGGLSLGAAEACRTLSRNWYFAAAMDTKDKCLKVYKRNMPAVNTYVNDVSTILDGPLGSEPTTSERSFLKDTGKVSICLAGPPCQGYSDLNNHTRRNDARNTLYERVARFVEIAAPDHILIENVPAVRHGKEGSLETTKVLLDKRGYHFDEGIVDLTALGVPQRRRRHVLIASRKIRPSVRGTIRRNALEKPRTVRWAIGDLIGVDSGDMFDTPSEHNEDNLRRMEYLVKRRVRRLPNRMRPDCHKNGGHSYKSVYGRLDWDEPSQTITSGYGSPGQGRYVHPSLPRTLTAHEAARLQFFPDFFDFSSVEQKTTLAEMIGNAVPMKLSYAFCLEFLADHNSQMALASA